VQLLIRAAFSHTVTCLAVVLHHTTGFLLVYVTVFIRPAFVHQGLPIVTVGSGWCSCYEA
jgi:hypothetical protein